MRSSTLTGEDTRRAARNAGVLAVTSLLSKGLLFGWQFVLARWLGDAAFGIYGTVGALAVIATVIGSFGMGLIVMRDVAQQPERAGDYLTATLFMQTVLVAVAFLVMNTAALLLGYSDAVRVFTALTGVGLIIDIYGNMASDQLLAQERMVTTSIVETVHIAARVGLVAAALWAGFGLPGLYLGGLAASALRSGVFWRALARTGVQPTFPLNWKIAMPLLRNSTPLMLAAVLVLIYQQADKLMSTAFLTEASTGYLTIAFVIIVGVIELLNGTVLIATYPLMARYYANGGEAFGFLVEKLVFFTTLVALPLCLLLSIFSSDIILLLLGEMYLPTAAVLRVLIWYALASMLVNVFARGMMVQNRQQQLLVIRGSGLALNLALNLAFLALLDLGLMGLVVASVIAEGAILTAMLLTFRQQGLEMRRLTARLLRPLAVGAIAGAVMLLTAPVHFMVGMALGGAAYAGLVVFAPVLLADEWDLLYRLVAAMPGGGFVRRWWQRDTQINW